MNPDDRSSELDEMKKRWKKKFWSEIAIFDQIHPSDWILMGTGCGEPQHLVGALKSYVEKRPNSFFGAEMIHVWTLWIAPCAEEMFRENWPAKTRTAVELNKSMFLGVSPLNQDD